ncbi:lytic transglycosylase domain-containing protein [Paenibacillus silviterrae]|uniref:lytic transglycosylase domain-containing protein n=1 Tax=Paenibacillus silviterrae TaxID=3242194 RepID=UPI0025437B9A|nr:lytic transglycosylase domain-containing protein [Paenibacillus chinjuensis]
MSIDPRTIKELLQLQILNKLNLMSSGTPQTGTDDSEFAELLNTLLAESQTASTTTEASVDKAPLKPAAISPIFSAAAPYTGMNQASKTSKPTQYDAMIQTASRRFGVDSSLVKAVIGAESSFNPQAVSRAGAKGLMQLMDSTGQGLGVTNPFDPSQNIEGGTRYLSNLLMKYKGNQGMALAAYNAGSGRVDKLQAANDQELMAKLHLLPEETQNYVRKVLKLKQEYQA